MHPSANWLVIFVKNVPVRDPLHSTSTRHSKLTCYLGYYLVSKDCRIRSSSCKARFFKSCVISWTGKTLF